MAPGGYATSQQREEYNRKKAEEAAERQRQKREYERTQALFRMQQEEQRQKEEAERKKQQEEKERQEFEEDVNRVVRVLLNPKEDAEGFLLWYETDYDVTAEEFHRIRAIPSEEEKVIEARKYIEPLVKAFKELANQPDDIFYKVRNQREDKRDIRELTNELLDPKMSTEQILSRYTDDDLFSTTPEEVYAIKTMTDPELQKIKAKFYAEQQIKARRERINQEERQKEEEAKAAKPPKNKNRALKRNFAIFSTS